MTLCVDATSYFVIDLSSQTSDDAALRDIIMQVVDSGDIKGKIVVETTTVSPNTARDTDELLRKAGAVYIACECIPGRN